MKKRYSLKNTFLFLFFLILMQFSNINAEKYVIGGKKGWNDVKVRNGITTGKGRFGYECLQLNTYMYEENENTDLFLDFENGNFSDKTKNYEIKSNNLHSSVKAIRGKTAALSRGNATGIVLSGNKNSFFGSAGQAGSFIIDFWLCPSIVENGEILLNWRSSRNIKGSVIYQLINISFAHSKIMCIFSNIFNGYTAENGSVNLHTASSLIPNKWTHHSIAFYEETGILEYKINGKTEDIKYITSTGHEGGSVYEAVMGVAADLEICPKYTGFLDDFRVIRSLKNSKEISFALLPNNFYQEAYKITGGRFESEPIQTKSGSIINSVKAEMSVPEQTAVKLYIRSDDNHYNWTKDYPKWILVESGEEIKNLSGLYFQVAAELFPDGAGKQTPSITELCIDYTFLPDPLPPFKVTALKGDRCVTLNWSCSIDDGAGGYYIYYGTRPGEYLGKIAAEGPSPINVGNTVSYTITGLNNETIYYFAIAAWSKADSRICGPLSNEVYARPSIKKIH